MKFINFDQNIKKQVMAIGVAVFISQMAVGMGAAFAEDSSLQPKEQDKCTLYYSKNAAGVEFGSFMGFPFPAPRKATGCAVALCESSPSPLVVLGWQSALLDEQGNPYVDPDDGLFGEMVYFESFLMSTGVKSSTSNGNSLAFEASDHSFIPRDSFAEIKFHQNFSGSFENVESVEGKSTVVLNKDMTAQEYLNQAAQWKAQMGKFFPNIDQALVISSDSVVMNSSAQCTHFEKVRSVSTWEEAYKYLKDQVRPR